MDLTVPISMVDVGIYPKSRWYSTTTFVASVNFSDGRVFESTFGNSPRSLRSALELKYGKLVTREFFSFLYNDQKFIVYRFPTQYTDDD